jgi:hypothetical protein
MAAPRRRESNEEDLLKLGMDAFNESIRRAIGLHRWT